MKNLDHTILFERKNESQKIDKKWLLIHYLISVSIVVICIVLELGLGRILYLTGEINLPIPKYIIKYIMIPSVMNIIYITISSLVFFSIKIPQSFKIYTVSIVLVIISFTVFTIHSTFTSLYFIFSVPILLTAIYGNYRLSFFTGFLSILLLTVSELVIKWDLDRGYIFDDGIRFANFIISEIVILFLVIVSMVIIYFEKIRATAVLQKDMERYKLRKELQIDGLTGIKNRISFRNELYKLENNTLGDKYIFVMIDIDNFKLLNDTLGHIAGDTCLINFGMLLTEYCGEGIPFRYGGDEFSILFKNYSMDNVKQICETLQELFELNNSNLKTVKPVTLSIGISCYLDGMTPTELIYNSDKALYESKKIKNEITVFNMDVPVF